MTRAELLALSLPDLVIELGERRAARLKRLVAGLAAKGRDGHGAEGIVGYFLAISDKDPRFFASLVKKLPVQSLKVHGEVIKRDGERVLHLRTRNAAMLLAQTLDPGCVLRERYPDITPAAPNGIPGSLGPWPA